MSAEPVQGHHVGDMVGCIASGWSWGLHSLMALRAPCIVSKGWRSETQFSSPLPSPLLHLRWNKFWVLFLLSKMPVVFRSSPMSKSAVITSGLYGGGGHDSHTKRCHASKSGSLNQRKHCNLSWRASLKIPQTFWSIKMFFFYFDSFFLFQSIRCRNKKPFWDEKWKGFTLEC